MTERRPRGSRSSWRQPADECVVRLQRASAHEWLDDMRAARRNERAPDDVRERLLERARELGQSVEGHAPSPPLGVEPALSLGLLDEGLLNERLLNEGLLSNSPRVGRLLPRSRRADRSMGEPGPLEAWAHPLLARVAGAGLMIGLVVLVIADVRRPSGSALPVPVASVPMASVPMASVPTASVREPSAPPAMSERARSPETAAAGDSPSEPPGVLAAVPAALPAGTRAPEPSALAALPEQSDVRPPLSGLAERFARALLASAPRPGAAPRPEALPHREDARPAGSLPAIPSPLDAALPWLSPQGALSAIRAIPPYLGKAPSFPDGTRVRARGNVRPDIRPEAGGNLITNGDFSRGDVMWSVRSWQGFGDTSVAAYYSVQAGALCTSLERNQQVLGGWPWDDRRLSPSSFELERGKRYRLSLRAWSSGPELVQLVVKVGHQKPPYEPAVVAEVPITVEPGLFDIDFVAARRDAFAGFAFVAKSPPDGPLSEFCIDDVSVRPIDAEP